MSLSSLTTDTQEAVNLLQRYAERRLGRSFKVVSTLRTCDQQNSLYAQGRTTGGAIITGARGCLSWHVLGRAVDISIPAGSFADYQALGEYWESLGGHWGGRFTNIDDPGHFEWHPGLRIEQVCPNPDDCEGGRSRSHSITPVSPSDPSKWKSAALVAGTMLGGFLLWQRRRSR